MRILLCSLLLLIFLPACSSAPNEKAGPFASLDTYNAISYGPYREGQHPGQGSPTREQIQEDLLILAQHWKLLRVYGSSEFTELMLEIIDQEQMDLTVMVGVWIAVEANAAAAAGNRSEVDAAIRLAGLFPDQVAAICVGNETQVYWSAHKSPLDILIGYIREIHAAVDVPVSSADDYNYWNKPESLELSAELDFITLHAHPMWNGIQPEAAVDWLEEQVLEVEALHAGKPLVVGETGWATAVHDEGEQAELILGAAGEVEQALVYREARAWAARTSRVVFIFEAFDEPWKGGPHLNEVEKHWGLFGVDRQPKLAMQPQ